LARTLYTAWLEASRRRAESDKFPSNIDPNPEVSNADTFLLQKKRKLTSNHVTNNLYLMQRSSQNNSAFYIFTEFKKQFNKNDTNFSNFT
jgi:hypothetical protein